MTTQVEQFQTSVQYAEFIGKHRYNIEVISLLVFRDVLVLTYRLHRQD